MLVMFISSADQTIVATALPTIATDLSGVAGYSWVFSAYMLASTVSVPVWGKLSDVYGKRPLLLAGVGVFSLGTLLCGTATSMPMLVTTRAVQGLGAGGLVPLALATLPLIVPIRDRGRYQGLMVGAWAGGAGTGPLLGGLIVEHGSWRLIFLVTVPVCVAAGVVIALTMPRRAERQSVSVDWRGAGLLAVAAAGLLVVVADNGSVDVSRPSFLLPLCVSVVAAVAFALVERRVAEPILPFRLLRRRAVTASVSAYALGGMVNLGVITFLPLFVQAVLGRSATASGLVLWPLMFGASLASVVAGQIVSRSGRARPLALAGPLLMTTGVILISRLGADSGAFEVARDTALVGLGWGLMAQIFIMTVQNEVPRSLVGSATAMMVFSRSMGAAVGVAVMGGIVNAGLTGRARIDRSAIGNSHDPAVGRAIASALHPTFAATTVAAALILPLAVWGVGRTRFKDTVEDVAESTQPAGDAALAEST
jgi:EmrB/QacA subfamily drug resistance transporter